MGRITTAGAWERYADALPARELFEIEDELRDLLEHPGYKRLTEIMALGRENAVEKGLIRTNGVPTQAEYARQAGYVDGLDEFRRGVDTILQTAEKERAAFRKKQEREQAEADRRAREEVPA